MPNIGGPELVIVLLIFVLLFGAKKLPELGSSVGKSIKNFKKGVHEGGADDDDTSRAAAPEVQRSSASSSASSDQA